MSVFLFYTNLEVYTIFGMVSDIRKRWALVY